jgi:NAD(P)-dependent dehydrogenase (short-subunit alcohol dehydrogenase family)
VAVVTGANRGLGLETCRQLAERGYRVVLTSRDVSQGEGAARSLAERGGDVVHHPLDVADPASIRELCEWVEAEQGGADVLVNNAAVLVDEEHSALDVGIDALRVTFAVNTFGPALLCGALVPGMMRRGYGRVVNVSSGAGQLSTMTDYAPAYSMSKAALNALTRLIADAARGTDVLINAADPGWVRTGMGGSRAPRSVADGADTVVWLATLPSGGPTGGFFHDRKPIPW